MTKLADRVQSRAHERRWLILGVLCFSLLVIVLDNSILNVALPSIVRQLHATNSQLQWMVDAYTLVFAGLLLTMGSLGDKFGRRPALQAGFLVFGVGSLLSALAGSPNQLIGSRAFMGIGGALIMPATLSIITNVFAGNERPKAIGVWAATAGVGVALGPLTGGALLEHFYWGSIFLVNLPIVVVGVLAGIFLIPNSKDPRAPRLDLVGAVLSIAGLSALLYAVIQAPTVGWTAPRILAFFAGGGVLMTAFFGWERRVDHPMLDVRFWRNPRFSGASAAIAITFFAMFGSIFLLTQYLQFVRGYSPLATGVRLLAFAVPMMIIAPLSPKLVDRIGTKLTVGLGLVCNVAGLAAIANLGQGSTFLEIAWPMALAASGIALTMSPATESIMGSLPLARAGVGSAVNDTTRQVGGAVGVAVIGSIFSSIYGSRVVSALRGQRLPTTVVHNAKQQLGYALQAAAHLPPQAARVFVALAKTAFLDGFQTSVYVGAAVVAAGVVAVLVFLPARPRAEDVERQAAEYGEEWDLAPAAPVGADGQAGRGAEEPADEPPRPAPARAP
ncbi:MAG TPA: MFS transporter [Acidimicrobiia bacterium]|jgi:EmrB/QacA subfamily drug resistance transporter|nr:MFS transporter [Acidimicrobiia bacterium]